MAVTLRHALAHALAVCGMIAVFPAFIASTAFPAEAPRTCDELRVWAEAYRDATPTLDDFARFDAVEQRAVFGVLAPRVRAAVWREHLRRLEGLSHWSTAQRDLLREARLFTTPALYEQRPARLLELANLKRRVDAMFVTPAERKVWFELGTVPTATSLAPDCNCNTLEQDCWASVCTAGGCNWSSPGCGFFLNNVCNGRCV